VKAWLVEGHGRSSVYSSPQEWAETDPEYKVTPLVGMSEEGVGQIAPSTDDTQERISIMEELYELMQQEIDELQERLEAAVEVIEVVEEFSAKRSDNFMENKVTLLLISAACRDWLKPSE
jgi:transcription initiation factor TFIID subunit TAF12